MENNRREYTLDLVRIVATFLVMTNHFFLHNGFYYEVIQGKRMYFMNVIRTFSLTCVPLFIILTGYLMCNKALSCKYYKGIIKTLCIYLLASFSCIIYENIVSPHTYDLKDAILGILGFKAAVYSWYIEMYIGLFLLIPFLNLIYNNLNSKKQKQWLIGTLLVLTAMPGVLNIYNFYMSGWWKMPSMSVEYQKLFPNFWTTIYPIMYYFIGCYFREYGIGIKRIWNFILLTISTLLFSAFCFYRYYNSRIVDVAGPYQEWESIFNVVQTALLFLFLKGVRCVNQLTSMFGRILKFLSELTLGAYLVSSIFDSVFYPILNEVEKEVPHRLEYFLVIVPIVFVCSFSLSAILNYIYLFFQFIVSRVIQINMEKHV